MDSSFPLTTLPPEILGLIAENVDKHDLFSLRLVCHEVLAAVDDVFLDTYFKRRVHMYSPEALQALVEITAHPHLVRRLEKVGIEMLSPRLPISDDNLKGLHAKVRSLWQEEMRTLADNDAAIELFSIILRNLTAAGRARAVTVSSSEDMYSDYQEYIAAYGVQHMHEKLGLSGYPPRTLCRMLPWVRNRLENGPGGLLHAIVRTGFRLAALELHGIGSRSQDAHEVSAAWNTWKVANAPWQDLTVLKISWAGHAHGFDLAQLLCAATGLKEFELVEKTDNDEETRDILDFFRTNLATTRLRSLKLKCVLAPQEKIIDLLAKFAQTLRILTLDHLHIEKGCWRPVFAMIERELHLERLEMSELYSSRDLEAGFYTGDKGAADFEFEGGDAIREGLEMLRERGKYFNEREVE